MTGVDEPLLLQDESSPPRHRRRPACRRSGVRSQRRSWRPLERRWPTSSPRRSSGGGAASKEAAPGPNLVRPVRPVLPGFGCLGCNGLIDPARLQQEATSAAKLAQQRYVDDVAVSAPSVITLNAVAAAHAANDYMLSLTGVLPWDTSRVGNGCIPRAGARLIA